MHTCLLVSRQTRHSFLLPPRVPSLSRLIISVIIITLQIRLQCRVGHISQRHSLFSLSAYFTPPFLPPSAFPPPSVFLPPPMTRTTHCICIAPSSPLPSIGPPARGESLIWQHRIAADHCHAGIKEVCCTPPPPRHVGREESDEMGYPKSEG